ncbi:hypothetical protein CU098_003088, partial [Rhizopus stolonifer]
NKTRKSMQPVYRSTSSSEIDYTNLYIKNLDPNVESIDLFNCFRKFGRIVSARVMRNEETRVSKGFGFVSFSSADEAQLAKQEMNGVYILSKPIVVTFHEPKKPREKVISPTVDKLANQPIHSIQPYQDMMTTESITYPSHKKLFEHQKVNNYHQGNDLRYHSNNPERRHSTLNASHLQNYNKNNTHQQTNKFLLPVTTTTTTTNKDKRREYQIIGTSVKNNIRPPSMYQQTTQHKTGGTSFPFHHTPNVTTNTNAAERVAAPMTPDRNLISACSQQDLSGSYRRSSVESSPSGSTGNSSSQDKRRNIVTQAVMSIEELQDTNYIQDIVDLLLTLKKKDLATCLFNNVFLKSSVKRAKDSLDVFHEKPPQKHAPELPKPKVTVIEQTEHYQQKNNGGLYGGFNNVISTAPIFNATHPYYCHPSSHPQALSEFLKNEIKLPPQGSKAIPIVAPKQVQNSTSQNNSLHQEIEKFLKTLEGLELYKQKQLLGDRLFPLVK